MSVDPTLRYLTQELHGKVKLEMSKLKPSFSSPSTSSLPCFLSQQWVPPDLSSSIHGSIHPVSIEVRKQIHP